MKSTLDAISAITLLIPAIGFAMQTSRAAQRVARAAITDRLAGKTTLRCADFSEIQGLKLTPLKIKKNNEAA
jgi:hypothetical protein